MKTLPLLRVSLTLVFVSTLFSCSGKKGTEEQIVRPVKTIIIEKPGQLRERTFSGIAKASLETPLSFRVGGDIVELPVKSGVKVAKGDLIARLDAADYALATKESAAEQAKAEALFKQSKASYERSRNLYEAGNISVSDLDKSRAEFESTEAQLDAKSQQLEQSQQRLGYTELRAPVNGTIANVPVELHQSINSGTEIVTLSSSKEMEVEVGIPESIISQIQVNTTAEVSFDSIPVRSFKAKVSEVGIVASESSSYPVKLTLLQSDSRIRSGMVAETVFYFNSGSEKGYLLIPAVAVVGQTGEERFVWIVNPVSTTVEKRDVVIGDLTSAGLEIKQGLQPGEILVVRGVHRVEEGMKVSLLK